MNTILAIVLVLLLAKLLGGLSQKLKLVELLGAVIAGVILGPVFHLVPIETIEPFGKIGLILILFLAGFEFRPAEIAKEKLGILSTGILGGLVPFLLGWFLGYLFHLTLGQSLIIGCIMAATSVSIAVGSLIGAKKINTRLGRYVLTSSIIDDVIGLFILIFVVSFVKTQSINLYELIILSAKIGVFAIGAIIFIHLIPYLFKKAFQLKADEIQISLSIAFILFLAYLSEVLGFSSIIGAFLAGFILSKVKPLHQRINIAKFEAISFGFFTPFFFAWVGMQLTFSLSLLSWFTLAFVLFAIFGKIIAAFISGFIAKMNFKESLALGVARMARGEVALSVLLIGKELGIVNDQIFGGTFILILVTVFLTPLLLKPLLKNVKE